MAIGLGSALRGGSSPGEPDCWPRRLCFSRHSWWTCGNTASCGQDRQTPGEVSPSSGACPRHRLLRGVGSSSGPGSPTLIPFSEFRSARNWFPPGPAGSCGRRLGRARVQVPDCSPAGRETRGRVGRGSETCPARNPCRCLAQGKMPCKQENRPENCALGGRTVWKPALWECQLLQLSLVRPHQQLPGARAAVPGHVHPLHRVSIQTASP